MPVSYENLTVVELKEKARDRGLSGYSKMKKDELIDLLRSGRKSQQKRQSPKKKTSSKKTSASKKGYIIRNKNSPIPSVNRNKPVEKKVPRLCGCDN